MQHPILTRVVPFLLVVTSAFAETAAKQDVIIRRRAEFDGPRFHHRGGPDTPAEMEKVAYLGVETMPVDPTVAAQLGLPRGTGVVVRRVAEGSPASGLLQPHDVLTKLDDQILVNMHQLTVLVRNRRQGEEVKLTLMRGGKETAVSAKLGEREVPKLADGPRPFSHPMDPNATGTGIPEMQGPDADDVMRIIGGDRMNWFSHPRVHVFRRQGGSGPTILDLPSGSFVFSDGQGSVEVSSAEGKRQLTVKDNKGAVTFQGPINTPAEHEQLPPEVKSRLDLIGGAEIGSDADELKVETKVFRPAVKTQRPLPSAPAARTSAETL